MYRYSDPADHVDLGALGDEGSAYEGSTETQPTTPTGPVHTGVIVYAPGATKLTKVTSVTVAQHDVANLLRKDCSKFTRQDLHNLAVYKNSSLVPPAWREALRKKCLIAMPRGPVGTKPPAFTSVVTQPKPTWLPVARPIVQPTATTPVPVTKPVPVQTFVKASVPTKVQVTTDTEQARAAQARVREQAARIANLQKEKAALLAKKAQLLRDQQRLSALQVASGELDDDESPEQARIEKQIQQVEVNQLRVENTIASVGSEMDTVQSDYETHVPAVRGLDIPKKAIVEAHDTFKVTTQDVVRKGVEAGKHAVKNASIFSFGDMLPRVSPKIFEPAFRMPPVDTALPTHVDASTYPVTAEDFRLAAEKARKEMKAFEGKKRVGPTPAAKAAFAEDRAKLSTKIQAMAEAEKTWEQENPDRVAERDRIRRVFDESERTEKETLDQVRKQFTGGWKPPTATEESIVQRTAEEVEIRSGIKMTPEDKAEFIKEIRQRKTTKSPLLDLGAVANAAAAFAARKGVQMGAEEARSIAASVSKGTSSALVSVSKALNFGRPDFAESLSIGPLVAAVVPVVAAPSWWTTAVQTVEEAVVPVMTQVREGAEMYQESKRQAHGFIDAKADELGKKYLPLPNPAKRDQVGEYSRMAHKLQLGGLAGRLVSASTVRRLAAGPMAREIGMPREYAEYLIDEGLRRVTDDFSTNATIQGLIGETIDTQREDSERIAAGKQLEQFVRQIPDTLKGYSDQIMFNLGAQQMRQVPIKAFAMEQKIQRLNLAEQRIQERISQLMPQTSHPSYGEEAAAEIEEQETELRDARRARENLRKQYKQLVKQKFVPLPFIQVPTH